MGFPTCGRVHLPFCMGLAAFWHVHLPFCMGFATCGRVPVPFCMGLAAFWHVHLPFCMGFPTCGRVQLPFCMGLAAFWHVHLPFCMGFATCGRVHLPFCMGFAACWYVPLPFCMRFSTCEHVRHIIMSTPRDFLHFGMATSTTSSCHPQAFKRKLVRKNASCGRWSRLAFTPSCSPHHHANPNVFTSLGLNMKYIKKREGGLGEGRTASPESRMKAPLLTCNVAVSFQEKVRSQKSQPVNPN